MSRCKGCDACGFDTALCFIEELGIYLCNKCKEDPLWKRKIEDTIINEKSEKIIERGYKN